MPAVFDDDESPRDMAEAKGAEEKGGSEVVPSPTKLRDLSTMIFALRSPMKEEGKGGEESGNAV